MAKTMQYSVVGLPHYVIWHLYEPSVDDIRHMEVCVTSEYGTWKCLIIAQEMEQERLAREKEEQEKKIKEQKLKEEFGDASGQWEKDKQQMREQQQQGQVQQHQDQVQNAQKGRDSPAGRPIQAAAA